jgi:hypothetical protein
MTSSLLPSSATSSAAHATPIALVACRLHWQGGAEVNEDAAAGGADEHVFRRDVAVRKAQRVQEAQRAQHVAEDAPQLRLADGGEVSGFICEPYAFNGARDITAFGGWRAFVAGRKS